jgi:hypothetical protein
MLSRSIINALFPQGRAWEPAADSDYDHLLDGIAANSDAVKSDLDQLAYLRDPARTTILSDLEKEYGVIPASGATEAERRLRLSAFMFRRAGTGAWDVLQAKLREAGFDNVCVYPNDPAIDPDIYLAQAFNMVCGDLLPGGNDAQCGEPEAICAQVGGELVVNGDLFQNFPNWVNLCGEPVYCDDDVFCGDFSGYKSVAIDVAYLVPADAGYWPLIFFVGIDATFDPVTHAITSISSYGVPGERRVEFRRIILRFKPMHSWGALIVTYI